VYDGVGKATFEQSLDCLRPRGLMVSFGNASGPVTGVNLGILAAKGSLFLTRPTLATHVVPRSRLEASSEELFDMITSGKIRVDIEQRYALADAAKAHADLASRKTVGSTVILP
jgi:NADPH2:quinone reductase